MDQAVLESPADVVGLVDYQAGTVVSRALVKAKAGTVTAFAFDAGEGLSEHTAPFDALLLVIDGRATVTIGERVHSMGPGQLVRLPANVPHGVQAEERFKMLLVMIREERS